MRISLMPWVNLSCLLLVLIIISKRHGGAVLDIDTLCSYRYACMDIWQMDPQYKDTVMHMMKIYACYVSHLIGNLSSLLHIIHIEVTKPTPCRSKSPDSVCE